MFSGDWSSKNTHIVQQNNFYSEHFFNSNNNELINVFPSLKQPKNYSFENYHEMINFPCQNEVLCINQEQNFKKSILSRILDKNEVILNLNSIK